MMKIALIDNMNNMFFSIARYLKDKELSVDLYTLSNAGEHFKPEADTFDDIKNFDYIYKLNYNKLVFNEFLTFKKQIKKQFLKYDIIIACGPMISLLEKNNIRIDIAIPYGWDLYSFPFLKYNFNKPLKSFFNKILSNYQRRGLKKARVLVADENYELSISALKDLDVKYIYPGIPMLYVNRDKPDEKLSNKWFFLENHDFIVFNHSRQWWATKGMDVVEDFDKFGGAKRNDKLIRAFSEFVKITKFENPILILFEYGIDVENSKKLIQELNIDRYVYWFPTSDRKDILQGLKKATFSSNAFRENVIDIGGVCCEALACGSCHLNYFEDIKDLKDVIFHSAPMINALSESDIINIFLDYEEKPTKYNQIAIESKVWFDNNLGVGLVVKYINLINFLYEHKNADLKNSYSVIKEIIEK